MDERLKSFDPNIIDEIREKYSQGAVLTFEDIENLITAVDYWRHGAAQEHKLMIEMSRRVKNDAIRSEESSL